MAMSALVVMVAALALLVLPGAVICLLVDTRLSTAVAAGPAVTAALAGVAGMGSAVTAIGWRPLTAACAFTLACVAALLVRVGTGLAARRTRRRDASDRAPQPGESRSETIPRAGEWYAVKELFRASGPHIALCAAVVIIASVAATHVVRATGGLTAIAQRWDAIFHAAAIRFIGETGLAGPSQLGPVAQPAAEHFYYPNTYHVLGALLYHLADSMGLAAGPEEALATTGRDSAAAVPVVINALSSATVWIFVVTIALAAYRLVAARSSQVVASESGYRAPAVAALAAAAIAANCWAFPYAVLGRGPLLPFALGLALIPGLVVLGEHVSTAGHRRIVHALLLGIALAGAWSVHPSVALAAAIPLAAQAVAGILAATGARARALLLGHYACAAIPMLTMVTWTVFDSAVDTGAMSQFRWPRTASVPQAIAQVVDVGGSPLASVGIAVAVIAGAAIVIGHTNRRSFIAPLVAFVVYASLFVLARAVDASWVQVLTSYFWDDSYRFAAMLVFPVALLAALGITAVTAGYSIRRPAGRLRWFIVAVLTVLAFSASPMLGPTLHELGYGDGPAVRDGERDILAQLHTRYDGGVVFNDPFDGTAWGYPLYGIKMVFPAPLADDPQQQVGHARMDLYTSINRYGYEPLITDRVRELDVRWVIVGTGVVGGQARPPGLVGLHLNPHLQLVAHNPEARLYQMLPVEPGHPLLPPPPGIPARVPSDPPENTESPLVTADSNTSPASLEPAP